MNGWMYTHPDTNLFLSAKFCIQSNWFLRTNWEKIILNSMTACECMCVFKFGDDSRKCYECVDAGEAF